MHRIGRGQPGSRKMVGLNYSTSSAQPYMIARGMAVVTLVRLARRRFLGNELLAQGANASSAALAALILLLLLGTQILSWQWAVTIPAAAAAAGCYQVRRRLPSRYRVAQIVDHRMALADTLSTALFFNETDAVLRVGKDIRQTQFARADRLAQTVDVRRAVPYILPRTVYLMAALLLVASSLFALRYGLSQHLDLKPPLASMLPPYFGGGKPADLANNQRRNPKRDPEAHYDSGIAMDNQDQKSSGEDSAESIDTSAQPDSGNNITAPSKPGDGKKQGEPPDDRMAGEDEEASAGSNSGSDSDDPPGRQADSKTSQAQNQQNSKPDPGSGGENSSLMAKMKDAMQNLLSRIKPPANQVKSGEQQSVADPNGKQAKGQQSSGKSQSKDGQQTGNQPGDAQEGQNGEEAKNSDSAQGKGSGQNDSQQASKQPGSGIGSQDGDKAIKNAEQLAAMGKISEILGKRSANISGEATVEVQSTSQQIRTPYAQRTSEHTQGGAQISRDEIPVSLQPYIQEYFEQVRKQSATPVKR